MKYNPDSSYHAAIIKFNIKKYGNAIGFKKAMQEIQAIGKPLVVGDFKTFNKQITKKLGDNNYLRKGRKQKQNEIQQEQSISSDIDEENGSEESPSNDPADR